MFSGEEKKILDPDIILRSILGSKTALVQLMAQVGLPFPRYITSVEATPSDWLVRVHVEVSYFREAHMGPKFCSRRIRDARNSR